MFRILIICTGNSCRSQMAEGILRSILKEKAEVYSAGTDPEKVNPYAIHVMRKIDIDISKYESNHVDQYTDVSFDYVITVCDSAKEKCPIHLKAKKIIHKSFIDPAKAKGTTDEVLNVYFEVRDALNEYLISFCYKELQQET